MTQLSSLRTKAVALVVLATPVIIATCLAVAAFVVTAAPYCKRC